MKMFARKEKIIKKKNNQIPSPAESANIIESCRIGKNHKEFVNMLNLLDETDIERLRSVKEMIQQQSDEIKNITDRPEANPMASFIKPEPETFEKFKTQIEELHLDILHMESLMKYPEHVSPVSENMFRCIYHKEKVFNFVIRDYIKNQSLKIFIYNNLFKTFTLESLQHVYNTLTGKGTENNHLDNEGMEELPTVIRKLSVRIYSLQAFRFPLYMFCNITDKRQVPKMLNIWENCLIASGIPENFIHFYEISIAYTYTIENLDAIVEFLTTWDLEKFDKLTYGKKYNLLFCCLICRSQICLKYFLEKWFPNDDWDYSDEYCSLIKDCFNIKAPLEIFEIVLKASGDHIDWNDWLKEIPKPLSCAIKRTDAFELCELLYKYNVLSIYGEKDYKELIDQCTKYGKIELANAFHKERNFDVDTKKSVIFFHRIDCRIRQYFCYYIKGELFYKNSLGNDSTHIMISDPNNSLSKYFDEEDFKIIERLKENQLVIEFETFCNLPKIYERKEKIKLAKKKAENQEKALQRRKQKLLEQQKREEQKQDDEIPINKVPNVLSKVSKEKSVEQKYDVKFTNVERQEIYLKLHNEKLRRLYSFEIPKITFSEREIRKVSYNDVKERAKRTLGKEYSEEVVSIVFAQEYFDPKTSTEFEKSKCMGHYRNFLDRNREEKRVEVLENKHFIELRPALIEKKGEKKIKKKKRKLSINLQAAKHEF